MNALRSPSLVRRVLWTLLFAIIASFVTISSYISYRGLERTTGDVDRAMLVWAGELAQSLEAVVEDRDGRLVMGSWQRVSNGVTQHTGDSPVRMALLGSDGRIVVAAEGVAPNVYTALPSGLTAVESEGQSLLIYAADAGPWRVLLIDDARVRSRNYLRVLASDMAEYLLIIVPILTLPVWLAVRAGLSPLRRLSEDVAARQPGDLHMLTPSRPYRELTPLVDALNDLLQRLARSLAREKAFIQDAAHEMRTPLAVISTQAHVLMQADGPGRQDARRRLDEAVARASHLTHQLLRLAQMDSRDESMRQVTDIMVMVRDTVADAVTRLGETQAEVSLLGPQSCVLRTDIHALRSILENLLDNALRYAGATATIEVALERGSDGITLTVTDDGPGIAPEERESVFTRFRRGVGTSTPGAGLGLAIVTQAAHSLGGTVHLEAGPQGRGCRFAVRLPIDAATEP